MIPQRFQLHPLVLALCACAALPAYADDTQALDTITVTDTKENTNGETLQKAYAGGQVSNAGRIGVLGEQNAADVPFNVVSYTSDLIENQQADTIADVLENDASVTSGFGYGNYAEKFMIRGFELNGEDISFGGMYGVLPRQIVLTDIAERVELFKGSSAFANGVSPTGTGVGGAINIEPKQAAMNQKTTLTGGFESDGYFYEGLDTGTRFGQDKAFGVRLNVKHGEGDTAIDHESRQNDSVYIGLDHQGEKSRTTLDFGNQHSQVDDGRSVVYVGSALTSIPEAPDASTNYSAPWTYSDMKTTFGMLRHEVDFAPNWTAYAGIGANDTDEHGQYSSPTLTDTTGTATIGRMEVPYWAQSVSGQAGVRGKVLTGDVSHQLNAGYSSYFRKTGSAYEMSASQATNIYNPSELTYLANSWTGGDMDDPAVRSRTRSNGISTADTIGLMDDTVLLTLGARYQQIDLYNYDYSGNPSDSFTANEWSPVYGVVYKPVQNVSLYANHIEALQPGDAAPSSAANAGNTVGIKRSKQNEIGVKYDNQQIGGGLSLFEIKQPNAYTDSSTNVYGYYGEQRNRGVEINAFGVPYQGVKLLGSAAWTDAVLTKTQDGTNTGNTAVGVAKYQFVVGPEWDLPGLQGWTLSARVVRTGPQYANASNTLELSPWTRLDLGVRYTKTFGDNKLVVRTNVENITNENYWASAAGGYLTQGNPLTAKISASWSF